ncbi:NUDIX domain-containing protein [Prosthecobacter sp.]|uniref:NUDIX domain-containing protein n=1 Tax=Prosthecobacter sp. TaxID=1965333 RepID=UPI0024873231|nr:NUDIX domain-containing protein [Prosthecobacter sp.]MDI1311211.1 NUDIX domain-containing protein [Prosthecobacter sp.]
MIRNLLFDWSGTLVDDLPGVLCAVNGMLRSAGAAEMTREEFKARFRLPYTEFFAEVLPGLPVERLQELYLEHFTHDHADIALLPHARELIQFAAATGRRLVVLSSAPLPHVMAQAEALGVRDAFEIMRCGVVDKRTEIHGLLAELDMAAAETAFIGDMRHDIDAGHAAGVVTIATCTGYESAEMLMTAAPDMLVPDLSRLPVLLGPLTGGDGAYPVSTVGALILNAKGEMLLIRTHKWSHRWGIPGGKIKRGENCEAALIREIIEETALTLQGIEFVMVQDCVEPPEFLRSAHFLLLNYIARCADADPQVVLNEEAQEFQWLPLAEALRMDLNIPTRILLDECVRRGLLGGVTNEVPMPQKLAATSALSDPKLRLKAPVLMLPPDEIRISALRLTTHIGVPEEERAGSQVLEADVTLRIRRRFEAMNDDIAATIDYAAVAARLQQIAAERPRRLIETLAAEMAACVLEEFQAIGVILELRKRILPDTDHVAVRLVRGE